MQKNNKNEDNDTMEILGEKVPMKSIHELLKQAMREQGYKTYIDFDGVEKPL